MDTRAAVNIPGAVAELPLFPTAVVVGFGNLGSQTIEALARNRVLQRVIGVDPDTYDRTNLGGQQILPRDVGRPKALVQARRLRAINPDLQVIPFLEDIANVPVGWLRGTVVLGCVDSIASRIAINEAVARAGATWIDGGVEPASGLARVSLFAPGPDAPCFECGLDPEDYATLPTRHLCAADSAENTPTHGSTSLGALCAAQMTMELEALQAGRREDSLLGRQLIVDARHHAQFVSRLTRNADCRFHHQTCLIQPLVGVTERSPVREALAAAQRLLDSGRAVSLSLPGRAFARALHCPGGCPATTAFALAARLSADRRRCPHCGRERFATGFDLLDALTASALSAKLLRRPLRSLGLRAGDVLTAEDGERRLAVEIPRSPDGDLVGSLRPPKIVSGNPRVRPMTIKRNHDRSNQS